MTVEADCLAHNADVPVELAELVVAGAKRAMISLRTLRGESRWRYLVDERSRIAEEARGCSYTWWQIGRALNRDHSTVIHLCRRIK